MTSSLTDLVKIAYYVVCLLFKFYCDFGWHFLVSMVSRTFVSVGFAVV